MAFWGVEVKPKKPFTLTFSDFEAPRLHLSQATLGKSKSDERTIVGCSVADSRAIYICSLLPGTAETCSLNLCFDGDVTFSVRGSSSVHLAGYFDGTFDGNESGEDVEDDGYSDEEEDEESEDTSLEGFVVSDDEEWSSEEDVVPGTRKSSGVTIEEIHDDPPPVIPKRKVENHERSLIPHVRKHTVLKETTDRGGILNQAGENNRSTDDKHTINCEDKHTSSSEDEDGFRVKRKRKPKNDDNEEQPIKKMAMTVHAEVSQAEIEEGAEEMDTDSRGAAPKKKKKKKKKKNKDSPNDESEDSTRRRLMEAKQNSGHDDIAEKGKRKAPGSELAVDRNKQDENQKGTVRKYANGLEVQNTSMGKPDGKQATPGKKVGVIYTGRLKSNDKIFDSNVGKKPFFFRLGVGDVIKGWDIGVNGMRVGDKRRITIPPHLGYGSKGQPGIPPSAWLVFTVELAEVK